MKIRTFLHRQTFSCPVIIVESTKKFHSVIGTKNEIICDVDHVQFVCAVLVDMKEHDAV